MITITEITMVFPDIFGKNKPLFGIAQPKYVRVSVDSVGKKNIVARWSPSLQRSDRKTSTNSSDRSIWSEKANRFEWRSVKRNYSRSFCGDLPVAVRRRSRGSMRARSAQIFM